MLVGSALVCSTFILLPTGTSLIVFAILRLLRKNAMSMTWALPVAGWASCVVADDRAHATVTAACSTSAPEDLLDAVIRLAEGHRETWALFDAGQTAFKWSFSRADDDVQVRVLELASIRQDEDGTEIWSSQQTVDTVVRSVISCFDNVRRRYGEGGYHSRWQQLFPRQQLDTLRTAWRAWALAKTPGSR